MGIDLCGVDISAAGEWRLYMEIIEQSLHDSGIVDPTRHSTQKNSQQPHHHPQSRTRVFEPPSIPGSLRPLEHLYLSLSTLKSLTSIHTPIHTTQHQWPSPPTATSSAPPAPPSKVCLPSPPIVPTPHCPPSTHTLTPTPRRYLRPHRRQIRSPPRLRGKPRPPA